MITIQRAVTEDLHTVSILASALWPENSSEEMEKEYAELLMRSDAAVYLAREDGAAIGFAQCQLRRDYVEGTSSSPVGYLEGIFVEEEYRRRGIAKKLLGACEAWAKEIGCCEFASDCELTNYDSYRFHLAVGFLEANRIICFTKHMGESI